MKDNIDYENFLRKMICANYDNSFSNWDYIERILNTCLANNLLSESFLREIWCFIPDFYLTWDSLTTDFKKEMGMEL